MLTKENANHAMLVSAPQISTAEILQNVQTHITCAPLRFPPAESDAYEEQLEPHPDVPHDEQKEQTRNVLHPLLATWSTILTLQDRYWASCG